MGSTAATRVSIDEYLSNPAYEHCEYVDGEIVELKLGKKKHSVIQSKCVHRLIQYQEQTGVGCVPTELHCRLTINGQLRFRLPDVCIVLREFDGILDGAPEFVVEIRSPDETVASQFRKLDDFFLNGTKLAWLIVPEEECVYVVAPNQNVRTLLAGDTLDGADLLPGLSIPVAYLFA